MNINKRKEQEKLPSVASNQRSSRLFPPLRPEGAVSPKINGGGALDPPLEYHADRTINLPQP